MYIWFRDTERVRAYFETAPLLNLRKFIQCVKQNT